MHAKRFVKQNSSICIDQGIPRFETVPRTVVAVVSHILDMHSMYNLILQSDELYFHDPQDISIRSETSKTAIPYRSTESSQRSIHVSFGVDSSTDEGEKLGLTCCSWR